MRQVRPLRPAERRQADRGIWRQAGDARVAKYPCRRLPTPTSSFDLQSLRRLLEFHAPRWRAADRLANHHSCGTRIVLCGTRIVRPHGTSNLGGDPRRLCPAQSVIMGFWKNVAGGWTPEPVELSPYIAVVLAMFGR